MSPKTSSSLNLRIRYVLGLVLCVFGLLFLVKTPSYAANGINRSFNYQGRLLTASGSNVSDGTYSIKFSLYDSASGGTRIYTASGTTAVPVALNITVTNGLFSVLIGDTTSQGQNALDIDWNSDSIYIGVSVSSDAEMTPRKRLASVPYAFNAETLQGNYASSSVTSTGGSLMTLHQTATDAASALRTALFVQTRGASNANDFLFRGNDGTSDVFTISRQGYTTTTSIAWTSASGSSLLVGGRGVCLSNGLNCPIGALVWNENATNNTIFLSTTTRDVLLGGTTTSTSGFLFDFGEQGTSTLLIGGTTNTNLLVGTSTYGGGLNAQFNLSGNDLLVQGQIGSIGGLFSATGVTVGTGSLVYGESNLYKTTAGDFTFALNNLASNWRFQTSSTERLTVASTGNIGIGVSTPLETLDVSGNIQNVLRSGQTFSVLNTFTVGTQPRVPDIVGRYLYLPIRGDNLLKIFDISNPSFPVEKGSVSVTSPNQVNVFGRYAMVTGFTANSVYFLDISNPVAPVLLSTLAVGSGALYGDVQGRFGYVTQNVSGQLRIIDLQDVANPVIIKTLSIAGADAISVVGRYAYVGTTDGNFRVVDVSDPSNATIVSTLAISGTNEVVRIQGRYAYLSDVSGNDVSIIDISNPASPLVVATYSTELNQPYGLIVSGRYVYVSNYGNHTIHILDVASSTNPIQIANFTLASSPGPTSLAFTGRYLLNPNFDAGTLNLIDIKGFETNGLIAHSAELGSLQVLGSGQVAQDFTVSGGLVVGSGGVYSQGALGIFASSTNATTTWILNNASATAPVLQVTSGCDTTSSTDALLLLAGTKTDNRRLSVNCFGTVSSKGTFNTGGADFAEYFRAGDASLASGEVVGIDRATPNGIFRASSSTRAQTLGVITANSGFIGNASEEKRTSSAYRVVALMGQVPTKVSTISGAIRVGDELMAWNDGVAVKARGSGLIIGRALEALPTGTGIISVHVNPHWWAGDVLSLINEENRLLQDLALVSSTVASATTPLVDSPSFTFRGSAWDASDGRVASLGFTLFTDAISATSSLFTLATTSGASLLTVSDSGDTSLLGDLSIGKRLFLGSQQLGLASPTIYLFVDDTLTPTSTYIATNADGWQTSSTYDYAERYESHEALVPGDLVIADPQGMNRVKRSSSASDLVLGIVSTKPGFVTGKHLPGTYPIALAGRVPTRVGTRNGSIAVGDSLTASTLPGVAMKAGGAGNIIGIALESYTGTAEGIISVFVKPGWQGPKLIKDEQRASSHLSGLAKIYAGSKSVRVNFASLRGYPIIHLTPYGEPKGGLWTTKVGDTGFEIVVGEAPSFDLLIAWTAESSTEGSMMHFSDNTRLPYDPVIGVPYGPAVAMKTQTTNVLIPATASSKIEVTKSTESLQSTSTEVSVIQQPTSTSSTVGF